MNPSYLIPAATYHEEMSTKKSRFIAYLACAENREQAEAFIRHIRQQHPHCNHVCWAYIAGPPNTTIMSMSDDGEPSGTAGRPILNTLQHSGLGEIVAAVVRYFGGIKLGTGGLQRAYSGVVIEALKNLPSKEKIVLQTFTIKIPYALESDIRYIFAKFGVVLLNCEYATDILIQASIAHQDYTKLEQELINRTANTIIINKKTE